MQPSLYPAQKVGNSNEPEDEGMQEPRPKRIRPQPLRLRRRRCTSQRRPPRQGAAVVSFAASIFLLMVFETSRLLRLLPPQHTTAVLFVVTASASSSSGPHQHRRRQHHTHAKNNKNADRKTTATKKQQQDYYELLGADKHCTPEQLKKCYRRACLQHHPDKGGNEDDFKRVSRAYQVLSDPQQRKLYDALGEAGLDQHQQAGGSSASGFVFGAAQAGGASGNPFAGGGPFGGAGQSPFSSFTFGSSSASTFGKEGADGGGAHINLDDLLREFMMMGGGGGGATAAAGGGADAFFSQAGRRRQRPNASPTVYERPVYCSLEELYRGATKKLKVSFNKHKQVSQLYSIHILPGYKAGTKLTFPATSTCPRQMVFTIQEKPHPIFERRGDDLVYRHRIQPSDTSRIQLSIPLLDGTTWTREIDTTSNRLVRRGGAITVPDLGMPVRQRRATSSTSAATNKKGKSSPPPPSPSQRGNLIIEFE